jgi:CubicO group peptidase (beta-lactamase class C family)
MGAAMLGGVNGNAGLFGNAEDLAKMMQMFLQKGYYGGRRYISDTTVSRFTKRHFASDSVRRGLGWDKPQFKGHIGPTFEEISAKSFGHQGFTGTMVWADPEENIVYIFLSNRTYPGMNNRLLYELNIRSEVQRLIYLAIKNPKHDYRDQYKLKGIPYPWEEKTNHH